MNTAGAWRRHPWDEGWVRAAVTADRTERVLGPTMVCIGRALRDLRDPLAPTLPGDTFHHSRLFQALPDLAMEECHLLLKGHRIPLSSPTSLTEKQLNNRTMLFTFQSETLQKI